MITQATRLQEPQDLTHVGRTGYVWKTALQQFDIMFPGRLGGPVRRRV